MVIRKEILDIRKEILDIRKEMMDIENQIIEIEKEIFEVMKSTFAKMGCIVGYIEGFTDHVHCLFSLGRDQTISDVIGRVKGASSFYINKNKFVLNVALRSNLIG